MLKDIITHKRQEVATDKKVYPLASLRREVESIQTPVRSFISSLQTKIAMGQPGVIAEIKKASPSKGLLRADFDPIAIAKSYASHGAACLSILTSKAFFQGSKTYLQQVQKACHLPLLRKDFIIDAYQVYESRYLAADAILLIAACLDDKELEDLETLAHELGLVVLVEVHNVEELDRALRLRTPLIGVNNRNLNDFSVSLQTTLDLLPYIPSDRILITESGILSQSDIVEMCSAGVKAFLVGELFMRAPDPGQALHTLFFDS
jgi:indole-3-glycerol phosphate synthase